MLSNEDRRVNELFKYYHPNGGRRRSKLHNVHSDADLVIAPDTTLTAICQLAALRLDVLRAGISLLSDTRQYILGESSQVRDLTDNELEVMVSDGSWGGFIECDRKGGLCDLTISCPAPTPENPVPCCTILDLRQSHIRDAPFVAGPPHMRFYCGTPITTEKGLNIGSFYVVDNRLLPEFDARQKKLLSVMASLVMDQLEARRETVERQKSIRMGRALSTFVNIEQNRKEEDIEDSTDSENPRQHSSGEDSNSQPSHLSEHAPPDTEETSSVTPDGCGDDDDSNTSDDRTNIFARASALIKDALDVEGCVFFDCSEAVLAGVDPQAKTEDPHHRDQPNSESEGVTLFLQRRGSATDYFGTLSPTGTPSVEVLGFSINDQSTLKDDKPEEVFRQLKIQAFEEKTLLRLLRQYPQGMLWSFGNAEVKSVKPEAQRRGASGELLRMTTNERALDPDIALILSRFPGIRHMLFAPLFDNSLGRANAACFVFTYRRSVTFSADNELSFLRSFMNNMAAELARMDASRLSSSKTNFISSISHELRSPLHGILCAAELLEETNLTTYQQSLVNTQISCGRTLLHVIEHVLDYSKINSFSHDEKSAGKGLRSKSSRSMAFGDQMQNLYESTDLAELAEEVVEGSVAGRSHASADPSLQLIKQGSRNEELVIGFVKNVAVILDFDYQPNWVYVTQPGAVRRILMNVLGNSLKYTATGCIRVRLKITDNADGQKSPDVRSTVQLTVSDTGRGISREFLRKRIFTAFQQEDHLSTGCGLGLSIVKSLVDGLGGKLEIKSELHVGTTVNVKLPLSRVSGSYSETSLPPSIDSPKLSPPTNQAMSCFSVGFIGFKEDNEDDFLLNGREARIKKTLYESVSKCMVEWVKMEPLGPNDSIKEADYVVILVDERLSDFIQPYADDVQKKQPRVIALISSEITRSTVEKALKANMKSFEIMSAPFGPRKVTQAVASCERTAKSWAGLMRRYTSDDKVSVPEIQENTREGGEILESQSIIARKDSLVQELRPKEDGTLHEMPANPVPKQVIPPLTTTAEGSRPALPRRVTTNGTIITRPPSHRLLLVDDNQINVRLLETFVRKRLPNIPYETAANGLEALEKFKEAPEGYAIVFMDLSMPVMDGLEATKRIREVERERGRGPEATAIVVALTGLANASDQANAFSSGCDLFMTKPAKFKEIGKLLDDFFTGT